MHTVSGKQATALGKNKAIAFFAYNLAVLGLCFALFAGENAATPRQTELYTELLSLKPGNYDKPGPWMLDIWDTDSGLEEFVPAPTGPGNAASVFVRLEELYPVEKDALAAGGEETRGVSLLLEAAAMAQCKLTPEYYPVFDKATAKQPDFIIMRTYLQALLQRGDRARQQGNDAEAERCFQAAIICGKHLTDDNTSTLVYMTGIIFKLRGSQSLEAFYRATGRTVQADAVKRYLDGIVETLRLLYWKANQALNEFAGFASLPCIVRIATSDKEPSWRKEAVVRLAILRHGVPDPERNRLVRNPLFEQTAEEALSSVAANDPDPTVRRMAIWATVNVKPEMEGELTHVFD